MKHSLEILENALNIYRIIYNDPFSKFHKDKLLKLLMEKTEKEIDRQKKLAYN